MTNVSNLRTLEQLAQEFDGLFTQRAFRLETLDYYDAPNEREPYRRFLAGEPVDPAWREPWKKLVREVRASGRIMQRVKIASVPLSDYVRFSLLHAAPASVEAGEDVRILSATSWDAAFMQGDYWLFDDGLAAELDYDGDGRIKTVRMIDGETENGRSALYVLRETRDEALELATPLARYVAKHNITGRKHAA